MRQEEIRPGMFLTFTFWKKVKEDDVRQQFALPVIYIIKSDPAIEYWNTIDLNMMEQRHLSWHAINRELVEYKGDLDPIKKKIIKVAFTS
jgi:hypothetical protein